MRVRPGITRARKHATMSGEGLTYIRLIANCSSLQLALIRPAERLGRE